MGKSDEDVKASLELSVEAEKADDEATNTDIELDITLTTLLRDLRLRNL